MRIGMLRAMGGEEAVKRILPHKPGYYWWLAAIGAISAGVSTALFSSDWCCTAFGMGILGAIVSCTEQMLMNMQWASRVRGGLAGRTAYTLAMGIAVGMLFLTDRPRVFEEALGVRPPAELRSYQIKRYYVGGPGDDAILIRFTATRDILQKLMTAWIFRPRPEITESYPDGKTWHELWANAIGTFAAPFAGKEWESVPPMKRPRAWATDWEDYRYILILWDEETGRTYVLSTKG